MDILSNFGDFISDYLIRNDMSLHELSKLIGIDDFVIRRWQTERYMPSLENLVKMADYFDLPVDYMLGLSESKEFTKMLPAKSFTEQLTLLMEQKQVSAYRLAKECGIGRAAISKWQLGLRLPKPNNIVSLCHFFGCSVDYIIGRGI